MQSLTVPFCRSQLGLHDLADASTVSERDRVLRQRAQCTLRIFDAYVTSSLGLPRSGQPPAVQQHVVPAPFVDDYEMLLAANANADLLGILSEARERVYLANDRQSSNGTRLVGADQLRDFARSLELWAEQYPTFGPDCGATDPATCSK